MGYPDFMYSQDISNSYISSEEVLHFLNTYADHFDLRSSIKLQHEVIRIRPTNNAKDAPNWEVKPKYFLEFNFQISFLNAVDHIILIQNSNIYAYTIFRFTYMISVLGN